MILAFLAVHSVPEMTHISTVFDKRAWLCSMNWISSFLMVVWWVCVPSNSLETEQKKTQLPSGNAMSVRWPVPLRNVWSYLYNSVGGGAEIDVSLGWHGRFSNSQKCCLNCWTWYSIDWDSEVVLNLEHVVSTLGVGDCNFLLASLVTALCQFVCRQSYNNQLRPHVTV